MNCQSTRKLLLDIETDGPRRQQIVESLGHMQDCEACQRALREFDAMSAALYSPCDKAIPPEGWDRFHDKLEAVARGGGRRSWLRRPLALAASVLFAVSAGFVIGRVSPHAPGPVSVAAAKPGEPTQIPTPVPATVGEPQPDARAFEQVSKVFDGRARWLLVSREASDVGLAAEPVAPAKQVLLLHLTVSRGAAVVSDAELMVLPGQTADLKIPVGQGRSLLYRIGTSDRTPTRLAVWLELVATGGDGGGAGQALGALATTLQERPGQRLDAGQLATSSGEYELKVGFARANLGTELP